MSLFARSKERLRQEAAGTGKSLLPVAAVMRGEPDTLRRAGMGKLALANHDSDVADGVPRTGAGEEHQISRTQRHQINRLAFLPLLGRGPRNLDSSHLLVKRSGEPGAIRTLTGIATGPIGSTDPRTRARPPITGGQEVAVPGGIGPFERRLSRSDRRQGERFWTIRQTGAGPGIRIAGGSASTSQQTSQEGSAHPDRHGELFHLGTWSSARESLRRSGRCRGGVDGEAGREIHVGRLAGRTIGKTGAGARVLSGLAAPATCCNDHQTCHHRAENPAAYIGGEEISRHGFGRYTASAFGSNRRRLATRC